VAVEDSAPTESSFSNIKLVIVKWGILWKRQEQLSRETKIMSQQTSIDPNEVAFFQKLSELWWQESGPLWPLHRMNGLRLDYICNILTSEFGLDSHSEKPLQGLRILDIGCGGGILSESVARLGASVHGVDVAAKNIHIARQHAEIGGLSINYEIGSAEILAGRGELYDAVLNMEVVEHVAELDLFLNACMKLVRPGGVMVVATINRTIASWLGAIFMAEYLLGWLPRGTHHWSRFPSPLEVESVLASEGMRVFSSTGVVVNPFTRRFRLTPYMGINYLVAARKKTALDDLLV
jgi:2-polyprenyl-6-hydroxyphenyl methylase/3-demethylubiquinone-9 3-methyltransferase